MQSGIHRENARISFRGKKQRGEKHVLVVSVSKSLCWVLRLPEYIDCKMFHIGYGPAVYFVLERKKTNKTKAVVNNEACHWPAQTQANLSLEKEEKQIMSTLNYPSSGHGPTYLVTSNSCFQNVCSSVKSPGLTRKHPISFTPNETAASQALNPQDSKDFKSIFYCIKQILMI